MFKILREWVSFVVHFSFTLYPLRVHFNTKETGLIYNIKHIIDRNRIRKNSVALFYPILVQ